MKKISILHLLPLVLIAFSAKVWSSSITWSSGFTYVNTNGIATDTYAQLIGGSIVDARYTSILDVSSQQTRVVFDTLNNRTIIFEHLTLNQLGGGFGGTITNTGDTALNHVLSDGYQGGGGQGSLLLSLDNLMVGQEYQIQLFSRTPYGFWINNTTPPVELQNYNVYYLDSPTYPEFEFRGHTAPDFSSGNPSWFITGEFTADSTNQVLTLYSALRDSPSPPPYGNPQVDAYIVAELVPEPSTYALLLLSGAASLWALRRRKS
jgi:hypothetical protein